MIDVVRFRSGLVIVMDGCPMDRQTFGRALHEQRQLVAQATVAALSDGGATPSIRLTVATAAQKPPLRVAHEIEAEMARLLALPEVARDSRLHAEIQRVQHDVRELRDAFDALQAQLGTGGAAS